MSESGRHHETLSATDLRTELQRESAPQVTCGVHTVTFQQESSGEDRHSVDSWELSDGPWKCIGIFDGHGAGKEAVEFVVATLPGMIKADLISALKSEQRLSDSAVAEILVQCISRIDDIIREEFMALFQGGNKPVDELSDDEIKSIIDDPRTKSSYVQIMRARTGTTAMVALIDPQNSLHVASLGDCEAVICTRNGDYGWETRMLSKQHNASNETEASRVKAEHPNEAEAVQGIRTLGLITVTRALGDFPFKLPSSYTRIFSLATPPFHPNYGVEDLMRRNLTPPYLSNQAEVQHINLSALDHTAAPVLILGSDGLGDLYSRWTKERILADSIRPWLSRLGRNQSDNLALDLLWDSLGGDEDVERASKIVRRTTSGRRVDDTTIAVLQL